MKGIRSQPEEERKDQKIVIKSPFMGGSTSSSGLNVVTKRKQEVLWRRKKMSKPH